LPKVLTSSRAIGAIAGGKARMHATTVAPAHPAIADAARILPNNLMRFQVFR
jgi:hypothetical protein